ncbi:MAG: cytochrome c3 family protein [Acidobacteriota bacterium]
MRRFAGRIILVALGFFILVIPTTAQISTTAHNLSTGGTGTAKSTNEDQVCIFCHTPHQATVKVPLWNHNIAATPTYGVYANGLSATMDATPIELGGATAATATISNLCLSCHDGTLGVNDIVNVSTIGSPIMNGPNVVIDATGKIINSSNLGNDLTDDHPVNFVYDDAATVDTEIVARASLDPAIPLFGTPATLQCASCHDAHDNTNSPFLVKSNANSDLCTSCHIK